MTKHGTNGVRSAPFFVYKALSLHKQKDHNCKNSYHENQQPLRTKKQQPNYHQRSEHAYAKTCDPFRKVLASPSGFSLARPKSDYHIMSPFEAVSVKYIASARLFSQIFEIIFFFLRFFEK